MRCTKLLHNIFILNPFLPVLTDKGYKPVYAINSDDKLVSWIHNNSRFGFKFSRIISIDYMCYTGRVSELESGLFNGYPFPLPADHKILMYDKDYSLKTAEFIVPLCARTFSYKAVLLRGFSSIKPFNIPDYPLEFPSWRDGTRHWKEIFYRISSLLLKVSTTERQNIFQKLCRFRRRKVVFVTSSVASMLNVIEGMFFMKEFKVFLDSRFVPPVYYKCKLNLRPIKIDVENIKRIITPYFHKISHNSVYNKRLLPAYNLLVTAPTYIAGPFAVSC